MPNPILGTLLSILEETGTSLTRPGLANFVIIAVGWLQTFGVHAVTQALVVTGVAGKRHHEAFHRFFSRGAWDPDELGRCLFLRLQRWLGDRSVRISIDDTVTPKKGPRVFGIASHLDAVRSTKRRRVFCFGHCWVVLAVLVNVPCFEDILRAARRALTSFDVLVPSRDINNLHQPAARGGNPERDPALRARRAA